MTETERRIRELAEKKLGFHIESGYVVYDNGNRYQANPNEVLMYDAFLEAEARASRAERATKATGRVIEPQLSWDVELNLKRVPPNIDYFHVLEFRADSGEVISMQVPKETFDSLSAGRFQIVLRALAATEERTTP